MQPTSKTGVTFITTGTITGAGISSTVGGMGIAGSFGAVGIGATAVTAAGGVVGAALYGAFTGITTGDQAPFSTIWNLQTGELHRTFIQHSTEVLAIAIHPDGKTIASSDQDGIIKLWNLQNGEILETLSGFSPLVFSPDGKMLVSGGKSGTIKIWQQLKNRENVILTGEWWEILGVDKNAHGEDVKIAYRKLARLYHPDINNTDTAKAAMQAINQAYQHFQRFVNVNRG
jgi:hypothetical protein